MAGLKKKRPAEEAEDHESNEECEDMDEDETFVPMENIDFTFEGFSPEDSDFHAIRGMLEKVFIKTDIDLSALTNYIISHGQVTTLLKQIMEDDAMDSEDDDDDDPPALGIITVLNLAAKGSECIEQVRSYLRKKASEKSSHGDASSILAALDSSSCGLVLSVQQVVHPRIAASMWTALSGDVEESIKKKQPYKFDNLMILSRTAEPVAGSSGDKQTMYCQTEEQCFVDIASASVCWTVEGEMLVDGKWTDEDQHYQPQRLLSLLSGYTVTSMAQCIVAYTQ